MIQRSCGEWPLTAEQQKDPILVRTAHELRSPLTFGGILVDTMGFGKTFTALLYLSIYSSHLAKSSGPHKPTLCLGPSGVVLHQWHEALKKFPSLVVLQAYGEKVHSTSNWISAHAMKYAPQDITLWPAHLRYIFDHTDPRASQVVILSSYDTFATRTVQVVKKKNADGTRTRKIFTSSWSEVFATVVLDEGHKLRNPRTKIYASIKALAVDVLWFLTATPVMNISTVSLICHIDMKSINQFSGYSWPIDAPLAPCQTRLSTKS